MQGRPPVPLTRDLVLVGGGHAHALVLRMWGMDPLPGTRVTVINPGPTAPYSGMLPGFVAGHYRRDDLDIDLVRLARFAGARVVLGQCEGIDPAARLIHVPGRPPIGYDLCSVNVGITSTMPALPGFAEHAVPAKPLGPFASRWSAYLAAEGPARVAVIGGGVAGAELILAMAHALKARGRPAELVLVERARALSALGRAAAGPLRAALAAHGVTIREGVEIAAIGPDGLRLADGTRIAADFITGAAGARPYDWIADTGLRLHDGFIAVDEYLQSSDPAIFAAGDCAHLSAAPRPKAGVYAVREAPVLLANLRTRLSETGPLRRYRPQKDYLKLISLGGQSALGEKWGLPFSGPAIWRWKNRIDQRFMDRFRALPAMAPPAPPALRTAGAEELPQKPMCGGCGAKVGRGALRAALAGLPGGLRRDVTPLPGDDAALLHIGGQRQVLTTDHLRAFTEDPVTMTRIAAVHALGDIWAMGATPQAATVTLILPRMSPALQRRSLSEIMTAADAVLRAAGAEIAGGHSSMGEEMTIGFTLTGLLNRAPITLAGGRPGDALVLTKPIGTGVLMAAEMQGAARGAWIAAAFDRMTKPQGDAAQVLANAHAMTDVTGFGLAGHLLNICEASGLAATLELTAVPLLEGALELSRAGHRSTLYDDNKALLPDLPDDPLSALLFDPQTAGGLLAAIPAAEAAETVAALQRAGYAAARIGALSAGPPGIHLT
ncbi:selenide, water dikinase SelD [Pseudodonghicola flavimaris]|uniref:Selenide, water dikinase SelD n=1 Tax=Pseudodonghicola flavimaris TaxID=3050036 RepID=A0ABT7F4I0_9RHOB|nr:selenide, water dikinase SelD [Pseudodonghicola flavimaris]MDK3019513.1 selenide, water dikinase SelD [Pseudodonghicola flavimaris]